MKNIHVLKTDKPSRLLYDKEEFCYLPLQDEPVFMDCQHLVENRHIYITSSDVEIKEWDFSFYPPFGVGRNIIINGELCFHIEAKDGVGSLTQRTYQTLDSNKKIILTTDPELIADDVQAIDDTFLEWFVKNPSCEFIEIESKLKAFDEQNREIDFAIEKTDYTKNVYQIIIPKEEQKQNLIDMMQDDEKLGLYDKPKQTAVEWLEKQLDILDAYKVKVKTIIEHAKEMEKQQLIEAHLDGQWLSTTVEEFDYAEQYYNETYKQK